MKDRRLKIIWNSNAPWAHSGYSIEQEWLLTRMKEDGWPIAQVAFVGLSGGMIDYKGIPIYPNMADTWGSDALLHHGNHFGANVRFTMQDVPPLNPQFLQQMNNWIPYVPIDQEPVPPPVLNNLRFAYKIITFSKWGHDALLRSGFSSTLIQEGTDVNIFKPLDKMQCRKDLGLPTDKFIIGQIGANKENPPRKAWQESLEAFKMFHDKHPDSIFFYQSNQNNQFAGGFPIMNYAAYLGIANSVAHIDEYMATFHTGPVEINKMLNAFDVLSHPSMTEGFGLIIAESQAAGTPVIISDVTSMPEQVEDNVTGFMCETDRKLFSISGGFWQFPKVNSLYEKMELAFKTDLEKMGEKAREKVVKEYNIDTIFKEKWVPLLEDLQRDMLPPLTEVNKVV